MIWWQCARVRHVRQFHDRSYPSSDSPKSSSPAYLCKTGCKKRTLNCSIYLKIVISLDVLKGLWLYGANLNKRPLSEATANSRAIYGSTARATPFSWTRSTTNLRPDSKNQIRYIFQKGRIIDSIRVFEFNFRNRNPQLLLVSRISNSILILPR